MPSARVYASNSGNYQVRAQTDGYSDTASFQYDKPVTADVIVLEVRYDFKKNANMLVPPAKDVVGAIIRFDFKKVPELRGKKITRIKGPYLYCLFRRTRLWAQDPEPPEPLWYGCDVQGPFLRFLGARPQNPAAYDPVGNARVGSYFEAFDGRGEHPALPDGVYFSPLIPGLTTGEIHNGSRYVGSVEIHCENHGGAHPPYLDVEYTDGSAAITGCAPQSGFIDEHADNRFSWELAEKDASTIPGFTQTGALMQWRIPEQPHVFIPVRVQGTERSAVVPAGRFPNGIIEWRVSATVAPGIETDFSPWYALTTVDPELSPPDQLSPEGVGRDGSRAILLSWRHNSPLSTPPSAFEVQIDDGTGWRDLSGRVAGASSEYLAPAGALPSGVIAWRVRDYNSDGVVSAWSEPARFTVRAAPDAPKLRRVESGTPRPLIEWISFQQRACQVRVLGADGQEVLDTGAVFGERTSMRCPVFLPDGRYRFQARVQNEFGLWSEWGSLESVVSCPQRLRLSARGWPVEDGARIEFDVEVI